MGLRSFLSEAGPGPAKEVDMERNLLKLVIVAATVAALAGPIAALASGGGSSKDDTASDSNYDDGVKAVKAKDYAGALAKLTLAVKADPKNADAWNYIGFADRKLGKFPDSLAAYEKALALQPNHLGANEYLGELYIQTGDGAKANQQLAKLEKLCGTSCDEYKELKAAISSGKAAMLDAPSSN